MKEQGDIDRYDPVSVQRMETDAAALGVIDRIGQQVVDVDDETAQHQAECFQPFLQVERTGNGQRNEKVQGDMEQG